MKLLPKLLLFATVAIGGCSTTVTWRQREGLDYFVGKTDQSLLGSLGAPTRVWSQQRTRYISYDYEAHLWIPGEPGLRDPNSGVPLGPWVDHRKCSTVFELQNAKVIAWSLDGDACRDAPFPWVKPFALSQMVKAEGAGIQSVTQFPDDPFTGSSTVTKGAFYQQ
jgi:hypothetical protein